MVRDYLLVEDLELSIGATKILNGVSFQVGKGEQLGIIGPNGSGKTTLFNCLSGFHSPSAGSITLASKNITREPPHRRAVLGIGRVFQNFGIFKQMTVLENMLTALEGREHGLIMPWSPFYKQCRETAFEHLALVGLDKRATEKAGSLSGGQMRLLEIVRAVACGAEVLLLDEPTAGVSPKMKGEVQQLLGSLRGMGKTVLIIEHDLSFIQKLAERIVVLDVGRVVLDDTPENVRSNRLLKEIYFGSEVAAA